MPIMPPRLDTRRYQDLLDEALARIPVHTPEWTNFGASDPGVTLIEVFAFLTESLLYRANQVPERNRAKFLQLLGVPLAPAASARGIVTLRNDSAADKVFTLDGGLEALAGDIAFRTERGLDVLPVDAKLYVKRPVADPTGTLGSHYNLLYASLKAEDVSAPTDLALYETVAVDGENPQGIDLGGTGTVDGCLWIALVARAVDDAREPDKDALRSRLREAIAGKTLNIGVVPSLDAAERRLAAGGRSADETAPLLRFMVPKLPAGGTRPAEPAPREAEYRPLDARGRSDVLLEPGIVSVPLPADPEALRLWDDLDPLEGGSGNFPPAINDTRLEQRVITWIRVSSDAPVRSRLLWVGINAIEVTQRDRIAGEVLESGSGEPDQTRTLARPPVVPGSVRITVGARDGSVETWQEIDDLLAADPEIAHADARQAPGAPAPVRRENRDRVYSVDAESGVITFGDGFRGRRPPDGAVLRASYDHSRGAAGNLPPGAINSGPALPEGFRITNPVRTWGGAARESQAEGEKQVARHLQHRDRLVTVADYETLARRTPGLDVGRVEVLPAFSPELTPDAPGNAPGAVTLMLVPRHDPRHPQTPEPDRLFLNAVCKHLDPRRLVTTELILRGPEYRGLWIAVGIDVLDLGRSVPEVREDVKRALQDFLSPLREAGAETAQATAEYAAMPNGWPLRKAVSALELMAVASRVRGVRLVHGVRIADTDGREATDIPMRGLQLPRIAGIVVLVGDAPDPQDLIGDTPGTSAPGGSSGNRRIVPVPVIPEEC